MRVRDQITFEAKDDAEALRLAGERLGKDAVILSTRVVRVGGFMGFFQQHVLQVTAGILQDDSRPERSKDKERDDDTAKERLVAFQKLLEFKQATEARSAEESQMAQPQAMPANGGVFNGGSMNGAAANGTAKVIYSPAGVGAGSRREYDSVYISQAGQAEQSGAGQAQVPPSNVSASENSDALKLKEDVENLSKRLDLILQRLDIREPGPVQDASEAVEANEATDKSEKNEKITSVADEQFGEMEDVYRQLLSAEVEPEYAVSLVKEYQDHKPREPFAKWLESKIKCAGDSSSGALGGKRVMLLGPTGAGKTTTIAKLAAIQALWEHKRVLLLTSDTYRIAAVEQLRTYAKILDVPIEVIFEVDNFAAILAEHEDADLILLDTAGRGQKDRKNLEAFEALYNVFKPDAVHLVLAANMKYKDIMDVVDRMSAVPVSHVIFTKLDETMSYGSIFNVLKSFGRPVSFFTTGQNVPNDIEVASGSRLTGLLLGDEVRSAAP